MSETYVAREDAPAEEPKPNDAAPAPEPPAEPADAPAPEGEPAGEGDAPPPEGAKEPDAPKGQPKWLTDRLARASRERGEAQRAAEAERERATRLEATNKRMRVLLEAEGKEVPADEPAPQPTTAADIERRAAEIAEQRLQAERVKQESGRVMADGARDFGADKWEQARASFVEHFGEEANAKPEFFDAIFGIEGGHKAFYDIASNPDEAARILALSPARMGAEIAKIAAKVAPAKRISDAPPPLTPLNGSARVTRSVYDSDISDEEFVAQREAQVAARRKARGLN